VRRGPRFSTEELGPYLLELPDPPAPFDWTKVFGADRPVEIEIGFGKGLFLINAGQSSCEIALHRRRFRPCTFTFPTPGGRSVIKSGVSSRPNSPRSAHAFYSRAAACTLSRTWKITS
jgi:hypothetical protein